MPDQKALQLRLRGLHLITRNFKRLIMKKGIFLLTTFLAGCFANVENIVERPPDEWSTRDCLTIVMSAMANNYLDQASNIQVVATPYYPDVVAAINRMQNLQLHWSPDESRTNMDLLLKAGVGLYINWENGRMMNGQGNYFRDKTEIDSLLFLVTLKNKTWPCNVPTATVSAGGAFGSLPLTKHPGDWPCYIPDISDIENCIILTNDKGDSLRPKYVWGRNNTLLSLEETLLAQFVLREGDSHFLKESENIHLVILGFEKHIKLTYSLSRFNHILYKNSIPIARDGKNQ